MSVNLIRPKRLWHQAMPQLPLQQLTAMPGSTANHLFKVVAGDKLWVLRLHGSDNQFVVDRTQERDCWQHAARSGLAPELQFWADDHRFCISVFAGAPPESLDPDKLLQLLVGLHRLETQYKQVNYRQQILSYLYGIECQLLTPWLAQLPLWQTHLAQSQLAPTFCHHDLHRGNILSSATGYLAIDFEYAGAGHPLFDLAVAQAQLPATHRFEFAQAYFKLRQVSFCTVEQKALSCATAFWQLSNCAWAMKMLQKSSANIDSVAINRWCATGLNWLNVNMK